MSEANQAATGRKRWTVDRGRMTARYRNAPSESGGAERAGHQGRSRAAQGGEAGAVAEAAPTPPTLFGIGLMCARVGRRVVC